MSRLRVFLAVTKQSRIRGSFAREFVMKYEQHINRLPYTNGQRYKLYYLPIFSIFALTASFSGLSQPIAKTPLAQYWIDVATFNMMGMDEMPEMPPGMAGMMGNMMGGSAATGRDGRRAKGVGNFGQTKHMGIGRQLDVALYTQRKPGGTEALHQVPPGAGVGAAPLRLITPPREGLQGGNDEPTYPERPHGRILFYWGCSALVKAGQPRVLDMAKLSAQDYTGFMQGRSVRDRGAKAEPGHAIWPNDRQNSRVVRDASIAGEHLVTGDGVPANMRFSLGEAQDFMQSFQVQPSGKLTESIRVQWQSVASARAYMHVAMSGSEGKSGGPELVIWSASEPPESGFGLMDYVSNGNIDKWLGERVLLPATQSSCDIPAGIFAKSDGAMLQSIAYGSELNIVHPPRPANANAAWNPEWSVRVRNKSFAMNALGEDAQAAQRGQQKNAQRSPNQPPQEQEQQGLVPNVGGILKGIFGR
jgi:hypothetical protein